MPSALIVATTPLAFSLLWAGEKYGWGDTVTLSLFAISAIGTLIFVLIELRAEEPILPMTLFSNQIVRTTMVGGFIIGIAMYSMNSYTGVFLQVVDGVSATKSGLFMLPMMIAVTTASITSGRLIARTGNYKPYPICGVAIMLVGALLLSTMDVHTTRWVSRRGC